MTALAEPVASATTVLPDCPYRGLDPFTDLEREYFFAAKKTR